ETLGLAPLMCHDIGGFSRQMSTDEARMSPSSRPLSPVPRLSPQDTPAALPYPILRRLSSPSHRRATPCVAWRQAARALPWRARGAAQAVGKASPLAGAPFN